MTATDSNAVTVNVNGIQLTAGQNGAFSGSVPLVEGHNTLTITAVDAAGNQTPATRSVIRDRIPPALVVSAPVNGFITKQTSIVVSGTATDSNVVTVTVNGFSLPVGQGGAFSGAVLLIDGHNTLLITARDAAGNETPATRTGISDTHAPVALVQLPLGLNLPGGAKFQVDDSKAIDLQIQTCEARGCYANLQISPDMLAALKSGKQLKVSFQNLAKETIAIPMPLADFGAAYEKIK